MVKRLEKRNVPPAETRDNVQTDFTQFVLPFRENHVTGSSPSAVYAFGFLFKHRRKPAPAMVQKPLIQMLKRIK
jgi:hypothetical protein